MMTPYFTDNLRTLLHGDAWALADALAPASVDCLVTSPPYWGLRDYGVEGQFGLEKHPQEWVEKLVDLFVRLGPALKRTATLWVNLGDTYGFSGKGVTKNHAYAGCKQATNKGSVGLPAPDWQSMKDGWVRPKQLLLLPSRFAIAMQDAGFLLRNEITWAKPNAMPSSAQDRLTTETEKLFLFTVNERYYFDLEGIREPHTAPGRPPGNSSREYMDRDPQHHTGEKHRPELGKSFAEGGKNPGDFWVIATAPFPEAHFATFPPKLIERPLKAGCPREVCTQCGKPKAREVRASGGTIGKSWHNHEDDLGRGMRGGDDGTNIAARLYHTYRREDLGWRPTCDCGAGFQPGLVLDPFLGSGTTLCVAKELGLRGIGFELSEPYCRMAADRIAKWKRPKELLAAEEAGQQTLFSAVAG